MHSVRRATLRAAGSSVRAVAQPRQAMSPFAVHLGKANGLLPAASLNLPRFFTQTPRALEEDKSMDAAFEESVNSAAESSAATEDSPRIWVNNITFDATEVHLMEAFSKFGEVRDVSLGRDASGRSRGFGFINYVNPESAKKAMEEAHKTFWHGRLINVLPATTKGKQQNTNRTTSQPTKSLYIGNIPYETTDADLNAMFRTLEDITAVRVAVDRNTGWPRGFAHADFSSVEAAEKALKQLESVKMGGRHLRLDYAAHGRGKNETKKEIKNLDEE